MFLANSSKAELDKGWECCKNMHFAMWTGSLSHVRRNGGKKQEYDIMSKFGEVTKKKSFNVKN